MKDNQVKRTLRAGGVSLGTMVFEFDSPGIARIAAAAGAEFAIFDMEHSGWSVETIRRLVATARSANLASFVRIPATEYHFIARTLDVGAEGLMVPMVNTPEQAQFLVASAKYPPVGRRGAAFGVAHDDYAGGDIVAKMEQANAELLLIAQIETVEGLGNVEAIAAVEGIDVVWIGHFDLTNSMGIPGQFEHAEYLAAVERVLAACGAHGKAPGIMVSTIEDGRRLLGQGFRAVAYGGDIWIYQQALREGLDALRVADGGERG